MMRKIIVCAITSMAFSHNFKQYWNETIGFTTLGCDVNINGSRDLQGDKTTAKKTNTLITSGRGHLTTGCFIGQYMFAGALNAQVSASPLSNTVRVPLDWNVYGKFGMRFIKKNAAMLFSLGLINNRNLAGTARDLSADVDLPGIRQVHVTLTGLNNTGRLDIDTHYSVDTSRNSPTLDLPETCTIATNKATVRAVYQHYNLIDTEKIHSINGIFGIKYTHGFAINNEVKKSIFVILGVKFEWSRNIATNIIGEFALVHGTSFSSLTWFDIVESSNVTVNVTCKADLFGYHTSRFADRVTDGMIYGHDFMSIKTFAYNRATGQSTNQQTV